jgi:hypothetical protein
MGSGIVHEYNAGYVPQTMLQKRVERVVHRVENDVWFLQPDLPANAGQPRGVQYCACRPGKAGVCRHTNILELTTPPVCETFQSLGEHDKHTGKLRKMARKLVGQRAARAAPPEVNDSKSH